MWVRFGERTVLHVSSAPGDRAPGLLGMACGRSGVSRRLMSTRSARRTHPSSQESEPAVRGIPRQDPGHAPAGPAVHSRRFAGTGARGTHRARGAVNLRPVSRAPRGAERACDRCGGPDQHRGPPARPLPRLPPALAEVPLREGQRSGQIASARSVRSGGAVQCEQRLPQRVMILGQHRAEVQMDGLRVDATQHRRVPAPQAAASRSAGSPGCCSESTCVSSRSVGQAPPPMRVTLGSTRARSVSKRKPARNSSSSRSTALAEREIAR